MLAAGSSEVLSSSSEGVDPVLPIRLHSWSSFTGSFHPKNLLNDSPSDVVISLVLSAYHHVANEVFRRVAGVLLQSPIRSENNFIILHA